jgi:uncharacterized SAM-binding protein YcdF (DUF218 family)
MNTMEVLILLTSLGLIWLVSSRRSRKRWLTPAIAIVATYAVLTSPWALDLATWGLTTSLPPDTGEPVDAIVVLGRGEALRHRRFELTQQLWQTRRSPRLFISGLVDARWLVDQLKQSGVPATGLGGENCSQTTEENALFTQAVLYPQGVRKILLVSDPLHLLRSLLMFRSVGFTVLPVASPLPPQLSVHQRLGMILREYLGLADYALAGKFQPRSHAQLENPTAEVLNRFSAWNCRVQGA